MALKLKVIIGSTRPGRIGPSVGKWAADLATEFGGFDVDLVDLKEIGLPLLDEANPPGPRPMSTITPNAGPRSSKMPMHWSS